MTLFVSSYHLEPAILQKDITEITFFHTDIKTWGEERREVEVGGEWGIIKAFEQNV